MSEGYTKLSANIVDSSVWYTDDTTFRVWIYMLAKTESSGFVPTTIPAIMNSCRKTRDEIMESLRILESPDEDTKTQEYEGRRLKRVDGGWLILNYLKYRDGNVIPLKAKSNAERQREYRQKRRDAKLGINSDDNK